MSIPPMKKDNCSRAHVPSINHLGRKSTYQSVLIAGLLPLLGHGLGLGLGEVVDGVEDGDRGSGELSNLEEDAETLTLGGLGAGTVRTKGNPVG